WSSNSVTPWPSVRENVQVTFGSFGISPSQFMVIRQSWSGGGGGGGSGGDTEPTPAVGPTVVGVGTPGASVPASGDGPASTGAAQLSGGGLLPALGRTQPTAQATSSATTMPLQPRPARTHPGHI